MRGSEWHSLKRQGKQRFTSFIITNTIHPASNIPLGLVRKICRYQSVWPGTKEMLLLPKKYLTPGRQLG